MGGKHSRVMDSSNSLVNATHRSVMDDKQITLPWVMVRGHSVTIYDYLSDKGKTKLNKILSILNKHWVELPTITFAQLRFLNSQNNVVIDGLLDGRMVATTSVVFTGIHNNEPWVAVAAAPSFMKTCIYRVKYRLRRYNDFIDDRD